MPKQLKGWDLLHRESLARTPVFDLRRDRKRRVDTGLTWDFYILEAGDWVNVVPVTREGDLVLVEITRHGIEGRSLEVPGGLIDRDDPSPMAAAARELMEETGHQAEEMLPLGVVHPNPAIQGNRCYSFLARNVSLAGEPSLDGAEDLTVVRVPLSAVPSLIREGRITHSLVLAALFWLDLAEPGVFGT
jgi:8-oxo-dGTP pyrophosphatase MutT (NUDIX family)